jgi:hypothetical protein
LTKLLEFGSEVFSFFEVFSIVFASMGRFFGGNRLNIGYWVAGGQQK